MSRALFGTDGVRGLAGESPLDETGAKRIGMAIGTHFAEPGQSIIIGCDPRESSADLVEWLSAGLTATGINVVFAGILPTPGLAYLTREGDFVAGVMVTASHNPVEYNGVKVFDSQGDKLTDQIESNLNKLIEDGVETRPTGKYSTDETLIQKYEDFLVASTNGQELSSLSLAVDSANGAASGLAEKVFVRLGAKVTPLFDQPDGRNINDGCGATNTKALSQAVLGQGLDLGIALDGDADRVMLIDGQGRELNGDHIIYILAVARQQKGVVLTVMSNLGTEESLNNKGVEVVRTSVGDRYVLEGLGETGYKLGGEQAGHIILYDLLATGDGLLAAIQAICAVAASSKSLASWRDEVKLLPQALVNIALPDKLLLETAEIKAFLEAETKQLAGKGRLLIRPSGTEPLARVMVEAPAAEETAQRVANELEVLLKGAKA